MSQDNGYILQPCLNSTKNRVWRKRGDGEDPKGAFLVSIRSSTSAVTISKRKERLTLLLQHLLLLLLHLRLSSHMTQRMRILRAARHALSSHLGRHTTHLAAWVLAAHPVRAWLHAHHRACLSHMRCAWARDAGVSHLLHLRRVHLLAWRHGRMARMGHAGVHGSRLGLVCCHHLASAASFLLSQLVLFRAGVW